MGKCNIIFIFFSFERKSASFSLLKENSGRLEEKSCEQVSKFNYQVKSIYWI
jgi:hypothetical protein